MVHMHKKHKVMMLDEQMRVISLSNQGDSARKIAKSFVCNVYTIYIYIDWIIQFFVIWKISLLKSLNIVTSSRHF